MFSEKRNLWNGVRAYLDLPKDARAIPFLVERDFEAFMAWPSNMDAQLVEGR
jgi:hypothetical protein